MSVSVKLENSDLHMALVRNVENTGEVFELIKNGQLCCGLVNASLIIDPFQLIVAANKSTLGRTTTKSVYTETLYNLSPSKNISQSLAKFGADAGAKDLIVFSVGDSSHLESALRELKGNIVPMEELGQVSDLQTIEKTYGIKLEEAKSSNLLDSIVTRIGAKSCLL